MHPADDGEREGFADRSGLTARHESGDVALVDDDNAIGVARLDLGTPAAWFGGRRP
jgi:hypothetical protein